MVWPVVTCTALAVKEVKLALAGVVGKSTLMRPFSALAWMTGGAIDVNAPAEIRKSDMAVTRVYTPGWRVAQFRPQLTMPTSFALVPSP